MKLHEVLLLEAIIKRLVTSFKELNKLLPKGWYDLTTNMAPFGNIWGRGIVSTKGTVVITKAGTKHFILKQRLNENTKMTFYWGYYNETLYLELASIRGDGFTRKNVQVIASAILDRMKNLNWQVQPKNIIFESSIFKNDKK